MKLFVVIAIVRQYCTSVAGWNAYQFDQSHFKFLDESQPVVILSQRKNRLAVIQQNDRTFTVPLAALVEAI